MLKIKNATIYTMAGQVLENSDILCENGKIKEVGNIAASADVEIDATGLVVIPGIIDAHSHIGTMDTKTDTHDNNEMTPVSYTHLLYIFSTFLLPSEGKPAFQAPTHIYRHYSNKHLLKK